MAFDESKYFKPVLEDFYPGYEFEIKSPRDDHTVRVTFTAGGFEMFDKGHFAGKPEYTVPDSIVVPYLTADRIEQEGWQSYIPGFEFHMSMNAPNLRWFIKDDIILSFSDTSCMLGMFVLIGTTPGLRMSIRCRDINRFRMIIKMNTEEGPNALKQLDMFSSKEDKFLLG